MQVGLIGVGVVGGTLRDWFRNHTEHDLRLFDPAKGLTDSLHGCEAIFIAVPVPSSRAGQDQRILKDAVQFAKTFTQNVFVRSTVLPGTNDKLGTIAMPEFLTERRAYKDMCANPVLLGKCDPELARRIFPEKMTVFMTNMEAELAKFTHNCFGAMKVTYFNIIHEICRKHDLNYQSVKAGASITGFIEPQHTQVPGPDGLFGYGGKCFPENVSAFEGWLMAEGLMKEHNFFDAIHSLNDQYRIIGTEIEHEVMA